MSISAEKKNKMKQTKRVQKVNARSLNGKGLFMDANHEVLVREYLKTGDEKILNQLPDYSKLRAEQ